MKLGLDQYADLDSPIHHWEPRTKLIALAGLIFAFSFVRQVSLLPAMLGVSLVLYAMTQIPFAFLLSRLRVPGFFLLAVVVLLPFISGQTVLMTLGPLAIRQEGSLAMILIVVRFVSIVTLGLVLFGTAPFLTQIRAMRSLGLPPLLTDMILLSYRYLFEIADHLTMMRTAMRLRGFRSRRFNRRNLNLLAALAGSLLVRSYEQSEQVYQAMRLRGYGQRDRPRPQFLIRTGDKAALGLTLLVAGAFVVAEILI